MRESLYKKMLTAMSMLAIFVSCSLGTGEKPGDDASTMGHPESVLLSDSSNVSISDSLGQISDLFPPVSYTLGDSADWLHRSMKLRVLSDDWCSRLGTDTCFYYPERVKIPVGQFQGKNLFLELGDFRDYRYYAGASVYWGDSLIYLTDRYLANDWHICMVHPLPERNTVYVLLLIASEAEGTPCLWNVVRMDALTARLYDDIVAEEDYRRQSPYFWRRILFEDIDGDGIMETGGIAYTVQQNTDKNKDGIPTEKLNENSDLIHTGLKDTLPVIVPSLIYQLGDELEFDYDASDKRTREQTR